MTTPRRVAARILMSPHAFVFDRYKRERMAIYGKDVRGFACPADPGLVSVVLPVYNGEALVAEAVQSILGQSYGRLEVVAVDDGSSDRTAEILEQQSHKDTRVRVIHQEHRGLPGAISRGMREARGEFLTWTSDDNRLKPEFLERMVGCLRRHSDWDMVYANLDLIGEDGRPLRGSSRHVRYQWPAGSEHLCLPADPSELNAWPNNYVGAAFLYRSRVAWLLGDYSPHRFAVEDYDYWMRVNELLTLRHAGFDEPLYEYRVHSRSLTARAEELGVDRRIVRLLVFDDFRRDSCLSPALWWIESEGVASRSFAARLGEALRAAGHRRWQPGGHDPTALPALWLPFVYAKIVDDAAAAGAPPPRLPAGAVRALVVTGGGTLPETIAEPWDLCLTTRGGAPLIRHPPFLGWASVDGVRTLLAVLDIRARSRQFERIEEALADESGRGAAGAIKASTVIGAGDDATKVEAAVAAAARQSFDRESYEVLVVSSDPEDAGFAARIARLRSAHFSGRPDRLRPVRCPFAGAAHARNTGISEARGEVVCFLEDVDDVEADWIETVWHSLAEDPDSWATMPAPGPPRDDHAGVEDWLRASDEVNWAARRKTLLELGGLRARCGRHPGSSSGDALIVAMLARRLGYRVAAPGGCGREPGPGRAGPRRERPGMTARLLGAHRARRDLCLPSVWRVDRTLAALLSPKPTGGGPRGPRLSRLRPWLQWKGAYFCLLMIQLLELGQRCRQPVCLPRSRIPFARRRMHETCGCGHRQV